MVWPRNQNEAVTQLDVVDFCKCSFGVDNVVVLLFLRIITGNFDIVNTVDPIGTCIAIMRCV